MLSHEFMASPKDCVVYWNTLNNNTKQKKYWKNNHVVPLKFSEISLCLILLLFRQAPREISAGLYHAMWGAGCVEITHSQRSVSTENLAESFACLGCFNTRQFLPPKTTRKYTFYSSPYISHPPAVNYRVEWAVKEDDSGCVHIRSLDTWSISLGPVSNFDAQNWNVTEDENA